MNAFLILLFLVANPQGERSTKEVRVPWQDMQSCIAFLKAPEPILWNFGAEKVLDYKFGCMAAEAAPKERPL